KGDDLRWLGYFIGRSESLQELTIDGFSGGLQRMVRALSDGIARNQSIQQVSVRSVRSGRKNGFAKIAGVLGNLTQLEKFYYSDYTHNNDPLIDCVTIGTLLESGVWKLKELSLSGSEIDDAGVAAFAHGLTGIGESLEVLDLSGNSIGSEGLSTLVATLANCTNIKRLDLNGNDFSMAAAGLRSLSDWLQTAALTLDELCLRKCEINDEGLQGLIERAANNCKVINLSGNYDITALGLRNLHTSLQSERCRLKRLHLNTSIGDDDAEIFARSLVGNKSLKHLRVVYDGDYGWEHSITLAGWFAFSNVLCDTSTVNNTYLSNHTLQELWEYNYDFYCYWGYFEDVEECERGRNLALYLQLNKYHPQHAARCKILMHHSHL
ncbi:hypothetical protein ACHAWT_000122, partial [Skeletonema menzelii]